MSVRVCRQRDGLQGMLCQGDLRFEEGALCAGGNAGTLLQHPVEQVDILLHDCDMYNRLPCVEATVIEDVGHLVFPDVQVRYVGRVDPAIRVRAEGRCCAVPMPAYLLAVDARSTIKILDKLLAQVNLPEQEGLVQR